MVAAPAVAEAIGIVKRFGSVEALRGVSLSVPSGSVHALVGRNGAGKSTLVAILTGLVAPDAGSVFLAGEPAPPPEAREQWRQLVACVYQRSTVIPSLTVAENLYLGAHPEKRFGIVSWADLWKGAERALGEWELEVDVRLEASRLDVEQRQIVEIARALLWGTRFIILDEPTAQLEAREIARLFARIKRLQQRGVSFLYISHHLDEIYEICQGVTVLRDGQVAANASAAEFSKEHVITAMVGDSHTPLTGRFRGRAATSDVDRRIVLSVDGLALKDAYDDVTFQVSAGECVGLAGLAGSGKEEVADSIVGLLRPTSGRIQVESATPLAGSVPAARTAGIGYVPRDRHERGLVPHLSIAENVTMTIADRLGPAGVILPRQRDRRTSEMMSDLQIVASSPRQPVSELSGGNQQKTVLARALAPAPKVLVLITPTAGVDVASKEALFELIAKARADGTAVVLVADELEELRLCDRVLVMYRGRIAGTFASGWSDHEMVSAIEGVNGSVGDLPA